MSTNELSPLLTAKEAAAMLQAAVASVYRWAESGRIPCIKVGRLLRFKRADLASWIESARANPDTDKEQVR